ncbi:MAG: hypothetical protein MJE12_02870 [Alphaproteobacteria bacterium]|nr:hypothetical protein [Alphaproteobacteria bacterium]
MLSKPFWFHEDDFNKAQFLPFSCWYFCCEQLDKIREHGDTTRLPDGLGWSSLHRIPESPDAIADLGIPAGEIAAAMPWRLRRADTVTTGTWSEEGEPMSRMAAYMAGRSAIVFGWNEDDIVDSLWFYDGHISWWHRGVLLDAFRNLNLLRPLLLVDWAGAMVNLSDREGVRRYLSGDIWNEASAPAPAEETPAKERKREPPPPERPESLYRFSAPVYPDLTTRKTAEGPAEIILFGEGGDSWALVLDAASLKEDASVEPIPIKQDEAAPIHEWFDIAGTNVLAARVKGRSVRVAAWDVWWTDTLIDGLDAENAVFSPDGEHVLLFLDDGIAVTDLWQPTLESSQSGLFPMGAEESDAGQERLDAVLDNPGSAMAVARSRDAETFTLAIGDYGFAVVAEVRQGGPEEAPLVVTQKAQILSEGLVYDPVEIVDVVPGDYLAVRHGSGAGLTHFDLRTGGNTDCPLPAENTQPRYGAFWRAVPSFTDRGRSFWVRADVGCYFWQVGGALTRASDQISTVLATDGERYVAVSDDGWDLVRGRFSGVSE